MNWEEFSSKTSVHRYGFVVTEGKAVIVGPFTAKNQDAEGQNCEHILILSICFV